MKNNYDVVIIGGGIVACSIAYHLVEHGIKHVALIEMDQIGSKGTGQSAAMVMHQTGNTEILTQLAKQSIAEYKKLEKQIGLRQTGSVLYTTLKKQEGYIREMARMQMKNGIPTEIISGNEISKYFPLFRGTDVVLGSYCSTDGYVDPFAVMQFYLANAKAKGVEVLVGMRVSEIRVSNKRIISVITSSGTIATSTVINAAGAYAGAVAKLVDIELPITCNKRHLVLARPPKPQETFSIVEDVDNEWYCRPAGANILIGVGPIKSIEVPKSFEVGALDEHRDKTVFESVSDYVKKYVPDLINALYPNYWPGIRAMTKDSLPILDRSTEVVGFINCCGLSAFGVTLAPICGRYVASLVSGQTDAQQHLLANLSLSRFATTDASIKTKNVQH